MRKGSITLSFAIVLLAILSLLGSLLETARLQGMRANAENGLYLAADSVFGGYGRQLYDEYGVFGVWKSEESIAGELAGYLADYFNPGEDLPVTTYDFHRIELQDVRLEVTRLTDGGGCYFAEQAVEFVKTATAKEVLNFLLDQAGLSEEAQMVSDFLERADDFADKLEAVSNQIAVLQERILLLKNAAEEPQEALAEIISDLKAEGFAQGKEWIEQKLGELWEKESILTEEIKEIQKLFDTYRQDAQEARRILKQEQQNVLLERGKADSELLNEEVENLVHALGDSEEDSYGILTVQSVLEQIRQSLKEEQESIEALLDSQAEGYQEQMLEKLNAMSELFLTLQEENVKIRYSAPAQEDGATEEAGSFIDQVKALAGEGLLGFLTGDANLPEGILPVSGLPSLEETAKWGNSSILSKPEEKAWLAYYAMKQFGNYQSRKEDTVLTCELEYLIGGYQSERDNLALTAAELVGLRESFNLLYLLTNSSKRNEAYQLALSIPGVALQPILTILTQVVILSTWALGESVLDVRALLRGDQVPLFKNDTTWRLSLEQLKNLAGALDESEDSGGNGGLNYQQYLAILILTKNKQDLCMRMMDLIQVNLQKNVNEAFQMKRCVCRVDIDAVMRGQALFLRLPGFGKQGYRIESNVRYQY